MLTGCFVNYSVNISATEGVNFAFFFYIPDDYILVNHE